MLLDFLIVISFHPLVLSFQYSGGVSNVVFSVFHVHVCLTSYNWSMRVTRKTAHARSRMYRAESNVGKIHTFMSPMSNKLLELRLLNLVLDLCYFLSPLRYVYNVTIIYSWFGTTNKYTRKVPHFEDFMKPSKGIKRHTVREESWMICF